jgi:hypothetical protein
MLVLLSPAKSLNTDPLSNGQASRARFQDETTALTDKMKKASPRQLQKLMSISENLSELNYNRFQNFDTGDFRKGKQAILCFTGDVYVGLDAPSLTTKDLNWAQDHVRILSGLYGVLRPLDMIQPYRLEMGTSLKVGRAKNLYAFWGDKITDLLNEDIKASGNDVVINLASNEYFKAVNTGRLKGRIFHIKFLEKRNDKYRFIQFTAKKARGWLCRYIIEHRITAPEDLQGFDSEGFLYNPGLSSEKELVFTKD